MIDHSFEWDDDKATANLAKHGVSFEFAKGAFRDPFAIEFIDDRQDHGEVRYVLIGFAGNHILSVCYAERGERLRLISARQAVKREQNEYFRQNA